MAGVCSIAEHKEAASQCLPAQGEIGVGTDY